LASAARRKRGDDATQPKERGGNRKALVVTAVELGGEARAKRVGTHCERTITTFLLGNVSPESVPFTDELPGCRWIGGKFRTSARQSLCRGIVRTDPHAAAKTHSTTAESRNATFKRAIAGVWHRLSIKWLNRRRRSAGAGNAGRLPWKAFLA